MLGPASLLTLALFTQPELEPTELRGADPASPGETLWLLHSFRNTGNQTAGAFTIRFYYISNPFNPIWNNPMGEYVVPAGLAPGQTRQAIFAVTLPPNISTTAFHQYGMIVDADDVINEDDENDNDRRTSFWTQSATDVDLQLFSCPVPDRLRPGVATVVAMEVRNIGGDDLGENVDLVGILSTDDTPHRNDSVLATQSITTLDSGTATTRNLSLTIPGNTPSGSQRWIGCWIDRDGGNYPYDGDQVEDDETNNVIMRPVLVTDVDLVAETFTVPGGLGGPGETIFVSGSVRNAGGAGAPAHLLRFIESASATDPTGGTVVGELARPALAAGQTATFTNQAVTLPAVIPPNPTTRYIHMVVDPADAVIEYDETNNRRSAPYDLREVDLVPDQVFAPASAAAGEFVSIEVDVRNAGALPSSVSTIALYENDASGLAGADLIGTAAVPVLSAGQTARVTINGTVPDHATAAGGTRFFIVQVDSGGVLTESDETNNVLAVSYLVDTYDLVVDAFGSPPVAGQGQAVSFTYDVRNAGADLVTDFELVVRLSANAIIDGTDTELFRVTLGPLAPGATLSGVVPAVVLPALPAAEGATAYFGLQLDPSDSVPETNEANNVDANSFVVRQRDAELTVFTVAPSQTVAGGNVTASHSVRNNGVAAIAAGTLLRLYDSTDTILDAGDVELATVALPAIASGATVSGMTVVTVPVTAGTGVRFVLGMIDPANALPEANELNNLGIAPVSISGSIDMVAVSLVASTSVYIGGSLSLQYRVSNNGTLPVTNVAMRFVASLDTVIDLNDPLISQGNIASLAAGATTNAGFVVTMPDVAPVGSTIYFGLIVDPLNLTPETNEANNVAFDDSFVRGPDLVAVELRPVTAVSSAAPFQVRFEVQNDSTVPLDVTQAAILRSDDAALDFGDDLLLTFDVPALLPTLSTAGILTISMPPGTPPLSQGTLFLVLDPLGLVNELDETNNVFALSYTANNTPPVAAISGPTTVTEGTAVIFTADGSFDPDNGELTYRWQQLSGPALSMSGAGTGSLTIVVPAVCADDVISLELEVCDENGACDQTVVAVAVPNSENDLPLLSVAVQPGALVGENVQVTFDASASSDCNGDPIEVTWAQNQGTPVTLSTSTGLVSTFLSPTVLAPEQLIFTVLACDGPSSCSEQVIEIDVLDDVNELPVAVIDSSLTLFEREAGAFDGSGSYDPNGDGLVDYRWTSDLGLALTITGTVTGRFVAPSVLATSTVAVSLIVVDDRGGLSLPTTAQLLILAYPDTDGDGLDDPQEQEQGTDPMREDTDEDGLTDGVEFDNALDPNDRDTDDDGLIDGTEPGALSDEDEDELIGALDPDSDDDGLLDGTEFGLEQPDEDTDETAGNYRPDEDPETTTDVLDPDTDDDGLPDGDEDANQNGRLDPGESDPNDPNDPPPSPDAGTPDATTIADGSTPRPDASQDGGVSGDAGGTADAADPNGTVGGGGCGCDSAGPEASGLLEVLLLGLVFGLLRSRPRRAALKDHRAASSGR